MVESFEEYGRSMPSCPHTHHSRPWLLFHSEIEFEFAELILASSLLGSQVDSLIKMVGQICDGEPFMVRNHCELETLWEGASDILAPVCCSFNVPVYYSQ